MEDALGHDAFICARGERRLTAYTTAKSIFALLSTTGARQVRTNHTPSRLHSTFSSRFSYIFTDNFFPIFPVRQAQRRRVYLDDTTPFLLTTGLDYSVGTLMYLSSLLVR